MIRECLEHPRGSLDLDRLTQRGLRVELLVLAVELREVADHLHQRRRRPDAHVTHGAALPRLRPAAPSRRWQLRH